MARHCYEHKHQFEDIANLLHYGERGNRLNRLEEVYTIEAVQRNLRTGSNILDDLSAVFLNPFLRFNLNYNPQ